MLIQTRRITVCLAASVLAAAVAFAPAAQAAVPAPPTKALPVALDAKTPYMAQVSCDPRPKPGLTAFAALMTARYKTGSFGKFRPCQGYTSEHYDGRAMDWTLNVNNANQKAVANSVTTWLSRNNGAMARRFGINYIIWNKKMWREYRPEAGWTAYTGSSPHTDHIHFTFAWDGAMKRTSWWTGKATTVADLGPCRVYGGQYAPLYTTVRTAPCPRLLGAPGSIYKVATYGQTTAQIKVAQRLLKVSPVNGNFGSATFSKVVAWQKGKVPVTGVLDKPTWRRLTGR